VRATLIHAVQQSLQEPVGSMSDRVQTKLMELYIAASKRAGTEHVNQMRRELSLSANMRCASHAPLVATHIRGLVRRAEDGSLGLLPTPDGMAVLAAMFKHLEINRAADRARRTT
jgi:hypothetical protein